jgi:hypothetical protein
MPYVEQERRTLAAIPITAAAMTAGELNYQLTEVIKLYVQANALSYRTINDVMGALEGAKLEFYRRVAAPYEDRKIRANGDVYPREWTRT